MMTTVYFMCLVFWVPTGLIHYRGSPVGTFCIQGLAVWPVVLCCAHLWVSGSFDVSLRSVQSDRHSEGHGSLS